MDSNWINHTFEYDWEKKIMGRIIEKLTKKNYWIASIIIVLSLMLFENGISNFISRYITFLPGIILSFISLLLLLTISRVLIEEVLEL